MTVQLLCGEATSLDSAMFEGLSGVKIIEMGAFHSVALLKDGTVKAWGFNNDGQCNVPEDLTDVIDILSR